MEVHIIQINKKIYVQKFMENSMVKLKLQESTLEWRR